MIDWRQITNDIHNDGYTDERAARIVGTTHRTLWTIRHGVTKGEPRYSVGKKLLELHKRLGVGNG